MTIAQKTIDLIAPLVGAVARRFPLPTLPDGAVLDLTHANVTDPHRTRIILGRAERGELLMNRYLPRDLDVVELGTNLGVVGSRAVRRLIPGKKYVGLEMQSWLVPIAQRNIERSAPKGVTVQVFHGSYCTGRQSVGVYLPEYSHTAVGATVGSEVRTMSLKFLLAEGHIRGGFSLLMDIEGSEDDLITNEPDILESCHFIAAELHDAGVTVVNPWGMGGKENTITRLKELGFRPIAQWGTHVYAFSR